MNSPISRFAVFVLAIISSFACVPSSFAAETDAPALQSVLAKTADPDTSEITPLLSVTPVMPLGPVDVLKGYENEMTSITQRMSSEMGNIAQAARTGQITREQAEFLIQQDYQVAMMQYQVLSALHETLERDIDQVTTPAATATTSKPADTAVLVQAPFQVPVQH
jgi:hypothetical protein